MSDQRTLQQLLVSYVSLLAERHAKAPDENFEYDLWDDLKHGPGHTRLVSAAEAAELITLIVRTDHFVTSNIDTTMFELIDIDAWKLLLDKRDH